ncbi:MAG: hypothetical protein QOG13_1448 [Sphingomonadales bacterium]|jgi:hypothetical protein|nr:hypothetical protein [Sphingomonadales bacterium]
MNAPYIRLGITLGLGALAMFLILSATIGGAGGTGPSLAAAYLALMMIAPIGVLMLLIMPHLYPSLRANLILYAALLCLFLGAYAAVHGQMLALAGGGAIG